MRNGTDTVKYTRIAMAFHWAIAALILGLIVFGLLMTREGFPGRFELYQWHKSFGILVLVLSFGRVAWRLTHKPPALPDGMKRWEITASKVTHIGFYVLLIAMPLLGWAMVSASKLPIPTVLFSYIPLPDMPGIPEGEALESRLKLLHEIGAKTMIGLLLLHVAGALKHHFVERDGVLARMVPGLQPPKPSSKA